MISGQLAYFTSSSGRLALAGSDHKTLCGKCGHEMKFNPVSRTWFCADCMISKPDLPEGSVRLVLARNALGKHAGKELSLWDITALNRTSKSIRSFGGFVGGGPIGQGLLSLSDVIRNTESKELRKRIEKHPELYPFCDSAFVKVLMRCSKCNSSVRADQDGEFCRVRDENKDSHAASRTVAGQHVLRGPDTHMATSSELRRESTISSCNSEHQQATYTS
jgi:hypothetical protein